MRIFVLIVFSLHAVWAASSLHGRPKCVPLDENLCKDIPYKVTSFPNLVGDENAKDAHDGMATFDALIKSHCSEHLEFYLCSVYFPMCSEKAPQPIGPCRPLCESVRDKCLPLLVDFGFSWPSTMNCSRFPQENNYDAMCMPGPAGYDGMSEEETPNSDDETNEREFSLPMDVPPVPSQWGCPKDHFYFNRTGVCIPKCTAENGIPQTARQSATTALFILAVASVFLTAACLIFVFTRPHHLTSFPERSLLWSAVSFAFSSIIYLFSLLYREQVACTTYASTQLAVVAALPHVPCTALAALLFYTGTAGRLWWFIMCLAWKEHTVDNTTMDKYSRQVTLLSLGAPLAVVMLALMARSVQADPLSGVCLVGAASKALEGVFPVARECLLFLVCCVPLLFGCCGLVGAQTPTQHHHTHLGLMACVYPIAAFFYVFAYAHDIVQPAVQWTRSWNVVSGIKLLMDPFMGTVSAVFCLAIILTNAYRAIRAPAGYKAGYQHAPLPQLPVNRPPQSEPRCMSSTYTTYASPRYAC